MGFADRIAAMRPQFLQRVAERLHNLTERLHDTACPDPAARLRGARIVYHDVAGTAPVLGFVDIGETARNAEQLIDELLAQAGPAPASTPERLVAAHDRLLRLVREAA